MKRRVVVLLAFAVLLAGCNAATDQSRVTTDSPQTGTETPEPPESTATPDRSTATTTAATTDEPDVLGRENGYFHNQSLAVDNSDGLNESERRAVVARAMARIEVVRQTEFKSQPPVEIIDRQTYRDRQDRNYTDAFRTFDNTKFEALLFVGEDHDALTIQQDNLGSSVLGYYDSRNDSIVLVSDSDRPQLDGEGTLAHELTHALQDQYANLSSLRSPTRDEANGRNGLVEGEANLVQDRYMERCGADWECIDAPNDGGSQSSPGHLGIYLYNFFPYADGPSFVQHLYNQGGWDAVDNAFQEQPVSAEQVIYPDRYPDERPQEVELTDDLSNGWTRVRPEPQRPDDRRPDYARIGQAGLSTMFMYTAYDDFNRSTRLPTLQFLNYDGDSLNSTDPIKYGLIITDGWAGDRLHVYRHTDTAANETAYVWRIEWDSETDARQFVDAYRGLISHWGGTWNGEIDGTYYIREGSGSPFADAYHFERDGTTVTIVNAPEVSDLGDVYGPYPG